MDRKSLFLLCLALLPLSAGWALADDERVWAALEQGGKVILLRHAHIDIREGIGHFAPGHCAEEVNLSSLGVQQAKHLGEALRAHRIGIGEVLTSPFCRCIDTGMLAFGRATPVPYLRAPGTVSEEQAKLNLARVVEEILKHRDASNLVMITHDLNISDVVLEDTVPMGELIVVQPKGANFDVIGKIRLRDQ